MPGKPWNKVHRDLDVALSIVPLTSLERLLVQIARQLCYATAQAKDRESDPQPFRFNFDRIARDFKHSRSKLREAAARLERDRVLMRSDCGRLLINKDYEHWTGPHELTSRQVAICLLACKKSRLAYYGHASKSQPRKDVARSDPGCRPDHVAAPVSPILDGGGGTPEPPESRVERDGSDQVQPDQRPAEVPQRLGPPRRARA